MERERLEALGLTVRAGADGDEAELELSSQLMNPITRGFFDKVQFTSVGDRLVVIGPPELVGIAPLHLTGIEKASALEQQVSDAYTEHILQLQRRSKQLQSIGLQPRVDPKNLILMAEVEAERFTFTIGADRRGNFRLLKARRDGADLPVAEGQGFELSEFREPAALAGYLAALFGEVLPSGGTRRATSSAQALRHADVAEAFGEAALIPPTSAIEVVVTIKVNDETYRFAAARVAGSTFRGLLAGPKGKVWAERFELSAFPGVKTLVSEALGVSADAVELLGPEDA